MPDDTKRPIGSDGLQIKEGITQEKQSNETKTENFDLGASMLGTDNEAGSVPDKDEMAQARNAPPPK